MDIKQIRLNNFLTETIKANVSVKEMCEILIINYGYMMSIINRNKNTKGEENSIRTNLTGKIEKGLLKKPGWLSIDHSSDNTLVKTGEMQQTEILKKESEDRTNILPLKEITDILDSLDRLESRFIIRLLVRIYKPDI